MGVRCKSKSKCIKRISQELYLRKKLNKRLVQFRRSWDQVKKIVNSKGCER